MMKLRNHGQSPPIRRGSLMVEVIVASVLLGTLTAIFVPGMMMLQKQRLAQRDETLLLVELNNAADKLRSVDESDLQLSAWFTDRFPDGKLEVTDVPDLNFVPADRDESSSANQVTQGKLIQITVTENSVGLPMKGSLATWPESVSGPDSVSEPDPIPPAESSEGDE